MSGFKKRGIRYEKLSLDFLGHAIELLPPPAARMKHAFGISIGLPKSVKNQIERSLERRTALKIIRHWPVFGIVGILTINHRCHASESRPYLRFVDEAVAQPICDMLTSKYAASLGPP